MLVHELLPQGPLATYMLPGEERLSAAVASDTVAVLASGRRLAALRRSDSKVLWQTDAGEEISAWWVALALQPAGAQVAVAMGKVKRVSLRDVHTGQELRQLSCGDDGWTGGIDYSPDGKLLASGSEDKTVRVWSAEDGSCAKVLSGHRYVTATMPCMYQP